MDLSDFSERQQTLFNLLLRNQQGMSIEQLSTQLSISRSAVQQQLTGLERDGYIGKASLIQTQGRPATRYVLTNKGNHLFPKHYNLLAELLLKNIEKTQGKDKLIETLQELGQELSDSFKDKLKGQTLTEQIKTTVSIMHELGYDAELHTEQNENLPMIDAYNCVFHALACKNTDTCHLDISILEGLLGRQLEHISCIAKGDCRCRFKIHENKKIGIKH